MSLREPLKVLMLTTSYPRNRGDSAGLFLRHLAEKISQSGTKVQVLTPAERRGGTCIEDNIVVHRFQYFPLSWQGLAYGSGILPNLKRNPWLWIQVPFFLLCMAFSLFRIIRKESPHIIHAHWVIPQGLVAVLAKLLYKCPVITTAHGGDAFALRGGIMAHLKRSVLRRSNAWTANTRATSEAFGGNGTLPNPHIIPMGVDVEHFRSGQCPILRKELPQDELLIIFVGRLVEKKGLEDLLSAFSFLPSELRQKTSLWVVGDGESRTALQRQAETLEINGKIRFWGQISNHLLPDFYAAANLLVVPSIEASSGDTEGQGVVILEAFAARLCVLATRVGGISEIVEDGTTGVLTEPQHPEHLSSAIKKLLNSDRLRQELSENAFSRVQQKYDWNTVAKNFEDLYQNTIQRLPGKAEESTSGH